MNRYLAICHALALLEQPLTPDEFASAVQPANPLFATPCITPQGFLLWLHEEGLLHQDQAPLEDPDLYQLSAQGQLLHQHLLNWTARDKAAIARQKSARNARAEVPVTAECPICRSDFCAKYLFVVMLERLYAGLASWNAWDADEAPLLSQALSQIYPSPARLYLLAETRPLSHLSPSHLEALEAALPADSALLKHFRQQAEDRLLLPELPELPHVKIPRLRYEQGLMPPEQLQALRRLAYPQLFHSEAAQSPALENHFIFVSRPGFNAQRNKALLLLGDGTHDRLWLLEKGKRGWKLARELSS